MDSDNGRLPIVINLFIVAGCFGASIALAIICECLRNFLRSRLAYVCRRHQREDRFGVILRDDELVLRACEGLKLATLLVAVMIAALARYGPDRSLSVVGFLGDMLIVVVFSWLLLNVLPWTLSRVGAEYILFYSWPVIHVLTRMVQPLLNFGGWVDTLVHRMAGREDPAPENLETFADEIQSVVDEGEREGILESRAGKMIQRVMELREEDIRAVMTPRTEIVSIQVSCSLSEAREQLLTSGHSRIPVVDGTTDNIIGILYARDLLEHLESENGGTSLPDIVRPPFYIPETTTIDALLDRMKQERLHMAIVLDEYGGVTGLVTLEDILEEIVGDIADEFDRAEDELIQVVDPHTLWVDARTHLDELNDTYELNLPEDRDFDTIGGFVFSELGRVPKEGEKFTWDSLEIAVLEATDRKLIRLELRSAVPWPADEAPQNGQSGDPQQAPLRLSESTDEQ